MITRILHVVDSLGVGGTEKQLVLNVLALDPQRFESYVCYLHGPDNLKSSLTKKGIGVYALNVKGKSAWPKGVVRLRRLLASLEVDLVHTQLFESDVIGGVAGRLAGVPVVSTLASLVYDDTWVVDNPQANRWKLGVSRLIRRVIAKHFNQHLIAVSSCVRASAIDRLGLNAGKVSVVHRSLSADWQENSSHNDIDEVSAELGLNGEWPVLLNTGRLIPPKGQRYIIGAMPYVLERFPDAVLLIAGDGSLRDSLESRAKEVGVHERVKLLGNRSDVRKLLEIGDVFVFPSLYEGCPNALLEAMASGVPCVVSDISPNREVTDNGNLASLVPIQDSRRLAEAIIEVASNYEQAKLTAGVARESVLNQFRLASNVQRLGTIFEQNAKHPLRSRCGEPHSGLN